jgi:hypothetical protein
MLASAAFVLGVVIAGILLALIRPAAIDAGAAPRPTAIGWLTLTFGLAATVAFAIGALGRERLGVFLISIACAFAAVVLGLGALARRERLWPTWVGLVAGAFPAVGWMVFAVGSVLLGST